jgi:hypothetical protein
MPTKPYFTTMAILIKLLCLLPSEMNEPETKDELVKLGSVSTERTTVARNALTTMKEEIN